LVEGVSCIGVVWIIGQHFFVVGYGFGESAFALEGVGKGIMCLGIVIET